MILNALIVILLVLLGLKILWNFAIAYVLAHDLLVAKRAESRKVSIAPFLDIALAAAATGISAISYGESFFNNWSLVLTLCAVTIGGSLLHFIAVGIVSGAIASRRSR
mgnify:CR=1 FL=1